MEDKNRIRGLRRAHRARLINRRGVPQSVQTEIEYTKLRITQFPEFSTKIIDVRRVYARVAVDEGKKRYNRRHLEDCPCWATSYQHRRDCSGCDRYMRHKAGELSLDDDYADWIDLAGVDTLFCITVNKRFDDLFWSLNGI